VLGCARGGEGGGPDYLAKRRKINYTRSLCV